MDGLCIGACLKDLIHNDEEEEDEDEAGCGFVCV